jgi:hypothetical protein
LWWGWGTTHIIISHINTALQLENYVNFFQEFLRRLQYKVNIVPVIGKADTLTVAEVITILKVKKS